MFFKLKSHFAEFFMIGFGERLEGHSIKFFATLDAEGNLYGYTRHDAFDLLSRMFMDEAILRASDDKLPTPFDLMEEAIKVMRECFEEIKVSEYSDLILNLCNPLNHAFWGTIGRAYVREVIEIEAMAEKLPEEDRWRLKKIANLDTLIK